MSEICWHILVGIFTAISLCILGCGLRATVSFTFAGVPLLQPLIALVRRRRLYLLSKTIPRDLKGLQRVRAVVQRVKRREQANLGVEDVVDSLVKKHPDKAAIIFQKTSWTFAQLADFSLRIANFFTEEGIAEGDSIALLLPNCPEQIGTWLGLSRLGVASALINYSLRKDVLLHSIGVTKPKAVIFSKSLYSSLSEVRSALVDRLGPGLKMYCIDGSLDEAEEDEDNRIVDLKSNLTTASTQPPRVRKSKSMEDILMYIYTSGTTGKPKAAKIDHRSYFQSGAAIAIIMEIKPDDVLYVTLPLYHSNALVAGISQMILGGCTVVLRDKFSASKFWDDCIQHQCTVALYIGELCRYLLSQPEKPTDRQHSVRMMMGNGLKRDFYQQFIKRFGVPLLREFYGSTEGIVSFWNIENHPGACGYNNMFRYFPILKVDPSTMEPIRDKNGHCGHVEVNEPGLVVGRILQTRMQRFLGYHSEAETKKKVLRDVFKKGDSYYNTGDLMMMDEEKYVYFCDRTGDTFRWKGENVSTFEVESVMSKQLQNRDVVVYGVEVPGCEGRAGMAAIVDNDNEVAMNTLFPSLKDHLPVYSIPMFVRKIKEPPMTGTNKFQKVNMRNEGFDIGSISEPVYFLHPAAKSYVPLTEELAEQITRGELRV